MAKVFIKRDRHIVPHNLTANWGRIAIEAVMSNSHQKCTLKIVTFLKGKGICVFSADRPCSVTFNLIDF